MDAIERPLLLIDFTKFMYETVGQLAKLGYNATRFHQMLNDENDGSIVAQRLVLADASEGLWRLKQLNRLDLSVEMAVLLPKYEELFDEMIRERAKFKLEEMDFNVDGYLRSLAESETKK